MCRRVGNTNVNIFRNQTLRQQWQVASQQIVFQIEFFQAIQISDLHRDGTSELVMIQPEFCKACPLLSHQANIVWDSSTEFVLVHEQMGKLVVQSKHRHLSLQKIIVQMNLFQFGALFQVSCG